MSWNVTVCHHKKLVLVAWAVRNGKSSYINMAWDSRDVLIPLEKAWKASSRASSPSTKDRSTGTSLLDDPCRDLRISAIQVRTLEFDTVLEELPFHPECPPPDVSKFDNPLEWPEWRKSFILWITVVANAMTSSAASMFAAAVPSMGTEWSKTNVQMQAGITIFTLGLGLTPMFVAPWSEIAGRRTVFLVAGFLWMISELCCGLTRIYGGVMAARFLEGCASSIFPVLIVGVISDIYPHGSRNKPIALYTGGLIFGFGLGPLFATPVMKVMSWRWIFYIHAMAIAVLWVFIVLFVRETRGTTLLARKAKVLNQYYEQREAHGMYGVWVKANDDTDATELRRIRWRTSCEHASQSFLTRVRVSVGRAFKLLFTEPTVAAFSLLLAFAWSLLYLSFSGVPYIFKTRYGFDAVQASAPFTGFLVGGVLSTALAIYQDKFAIRHNLFGSSPEQRLRFCCYECLLLPLGLFLMGSAAYSNVPWIVPTIGMAFMTMGVVQIYLAANAYLANAYGIYASSATAAQAFSRSMVSSIFPLFTERMYTQLHIRGTDWLLGGIALGLCIIPWILFLFGHSIRRRSKICSQLMTDSR